MIQQLRTYKFVNDVKIDAVDKEAAQKIFEAQYKDIKNLTCSYVGWIVFDV